MEVVNVTEFCSKVKMCKVIAALTVSLIGLCDALGSNSSLLGSKVTSVSIRIPQITGSYHALSETELKFVVSIGAVEHTEKGFLLHECLGNMVSPWNAISSAVCGSYMYGISSTFEEKLHVNFQRYATDDNKKFPIEDFGTMGYKLVFLTLEEGVPFMTENHLPVLQDEVEDHVDEMIGWNRLEECYPFSMARPYIKIAASVEENFASCGIPSKRGHFCVKLASPNQQIVKEDYGAPVFHNNILVGVITGHHDRHGIAARVIKARIDKRIVPHI